MKMTQRIRHLFRCEDIYSCALACGCWDEQCMTCGTKLITRRCEDHGGPLDIRVGDGVMR